MVRRASRTAALPVTALLAVAAAAGCAGDDEPPAGAGSPPPSASAPAGPDAPAPPTTPAPPITPAPSATPGRPASQPLAEYRKQGGLAGVDVHLTVWPDGRYELRRATRTSGGRLPRAELDRLTATLDAANVADLPSVNSAGDVADGFTYYVTYGEHTVLAQDGAVPAALGPVIGAFERVQRRHG